MKKYILTLILGLLTFVGFGQTYYNMSTSNYTQTFTNISATWPINWSMVNILNTGVIPNATIITNPISPASLSPITIGNSTHIGQDLSTSTKLVFLSTGTSDNTTSISCDLNLNFSGRDAGNISFDVATIFNGSGAPNPNPLNRKGTLRLYYSINNTNWFELTGANLPYIATNNISGSSSISIILPNAIDNQSTVKFRFYSHNGPVSATPVSGSRPKISLDNINVTSSPLSGLPIELISFDGTKKQNYNLLEWVTASENNNDYFRLERSEDGIIWTNIGNIDGSGNSNTKMSYSFTDVTFSRKINYYRLSQVDYNGASETFDLISINNSISRKTISKYYNLLGQEVDEYQTGIIILQYEDGTMEKVMR